MRLLPPDSAHGWTPYIWLVYAVPFVVFPLLYGPGAYGWAAHVVGLPVFLALYFRGYWVEGGQRLAISVGLTVLGVALVPVNAGAAMFFVFATSFVGEARTGRTAAAWIGAFTLVGVASVWLTGWFAPALVAGVAVFAPLIGFVNVHYALERRRDGSLLLAQAEIGRLAAQAERHRIAADVHDVLGQSLSVIVLKAELASKLMSRHPEAAAAEVADIERTSREALSQVRRVVSGIRSASLGDEWRRAGTVLKAAGVKVAQSPASLDADAVAALPMAAEAEHALAMAVREAVTNVMRHSRATSCRLTLTQAPGLVRCRVADNGVGGAFVEGNGLMGMRARLNEIGATVVRDPGAGTSLVFTVPCRPNAGAR
jgi:two-component system sensor histidine kinase DesK